MKNLIISFVFASATLGASAIGPCKSVLCCTPTVCCNPGQFCPIDLTANDLLQSGIVSFER